MKLFPLFLSCCLSLTLMGQHWCLDHTVWTYYTNNLINEGTTNILYISDTVVDGQTCHKLEVRSDIYGFERSYLYSYYSNDTIFFYHYDYGFWPTYFFNAGIGDTIWHRDPYPDAVCQTVWPFIVDSVGTIDLMGDSLRYYRYTSIDTNLVHPAQLEVAEKLGAINDFMMPGATCVFHEEVFLYQLNCYEDVTLAFLKLIPHINCEVISKVTENDYSHQWVLYPNPTGSHLQVKMSSTTDAFYIVMDLQGRILAQGEIQSGGLLDVSSIPSGLYLLKLQLPNGNHAIKRFVKE